MFNVVRLNGNQGHGDEYDSGDSETTTMVRGHKKQQMSPVGIGHIGQILEDANDDEGCNTNWRAKG